jgi:hypothetical protein
MALITAALIAGPSLAVAQSAEAAPGAKALAASSGMHWGSGSAVSPTGLRRDPEPAHRVSTIIPHIAGTQESPALSTNWSGYVETGTTFTGVSAHWIVPKVQPSSTDQSSSTWVGIDGWSNQDLIQTGTEQDTNGGGTYFAWYEILPNSAVVIGEVAPGDQMTASIAQNSPGTWTITIADVTLGVSASGQVAYGGPASSAEYIEESPFLNNVQPPLANFGTAQFTNTTSTERMRVPPLRLRST